MGLETYIHCEEGKIKMQSTPLETFAKNCEYLNQWSSSFETTSSDSGSQNPKIATLDITKLDDQTDKNILTGEIEAISGQNILNVGKNREFAKKVKLSAKYSGAFLIKWSRQGILPFIINKKGQQFLKAKYYNEVEPPIFKFLNTRQEIYKVDSQNSGSGNLSILDIVRNKRFNKADVFWNISEKDTQNLASLLNNDQWDKRITVDKAHSDVRWNFILAECENVIFDISDCSDALTLSGNNIKMLGEVTFATKIKNLHFKNHSLPPKFKFESTKDLKITFSEENYLSGIINGGFLIFQKNASLKLKNNSGLCNIRKAKFFGENLIDLKHRSNYDSTAILSGIFESLAPNNKLMIAENFDFKDLLLSVRDQDQANYFHVDYEVEGVHIGLSKNLRIIGKSTVDRVPEFQAQSLYTIHNLSTNLDKTIHFYEILKFAKINNRKTFFDLNYSDVTADGWMNILYFIKGWKEKHEFLINKRCRTIEFNFLSSKETDDITLKAEENMKNHTVYFEGVNIGFQSNLIIDSNIKNLGFSKYAFPKNISFVDPQKMALYFKGANILDKKFKFSDSLVTIYQNSALILQNELQLLGNSEIQGFVFGNSQGILNLACITDPKKINVTFTANSNSCIINVGYHRDFPQLKVVSHQDSKPVINWHSNVSPIIVDQAKYITATSDIPSIFAYDPMVLSLRNLRFAEGVLNRDFVEGSCLIWKVDKSKITIMELLQRPDLNRLEILFDLDKSVDFIKNWNIGQRRMVLTPECNIIKFNMRSQNPLVIEYIDEQAYNNLQWHQHIEKNKIMLTGDNRQLNAKVSFSDNITNITCSRFGCPAIVSKNYPTTITVLNGIIQ